jgi:hypothetical protein
LKKAKDNNIDYSAHERLSSRITDMSISLLKDTGGVLPLRDQSKTYVVFAGDGEMYGRSPLKKHFEKWSSLRGSAEEPPDITAMPAGAPDLGCYTALFAIFTNVSAWKGSSGISEAEKNGIRDLIKEAGHSIVISFGSPYVLRHFREADVLIAAYEPTEQAQRSALKCLEGSLDFGGRLPVKIDWPG